MPQTTLHTQTVRFVWEVDPASPVETFMPGQGRATAKVRTAYDLRQPFLDLVTGYSYLAKQGTKKVIRRITPLAYPYHRGLYCTGASRVEGVSPGLPTMPQGTTSKIHFLRYAPGAIDNETYTQPQLNQPDYLDARIELTFATLPYRVREDTDPEMISQDITNQGWLGKVDEGDALRRGKKRYIARTATDTGKLVTIPGNFMYYKDFGIPIPNSSNAVYVFSQDLVYEWFDIPEEAIPFSAIAACAAKTNDKVFDGYPVETLLFKGYGLKRETSAFGLESYTIRYTFRYLPNFDSEAQVARGHNWVLAIGPTYLNNGTTLNPNRGKLGYLEVCSRGTTLTTGNPQNMPNTNLPARPVAPMNGSKLYPPADFRFLFRAEQ